MQQHHWSLKQHCPIYVATTAVNNTCIYINTSILSLTSVYTGLDPQTKALVGHCACVVETGLATQCWSAKSEGCA